MKTPCEAVQRQMLALTDPDRPPTSVQTHLDTCPACQEWQKRVVQLDRSAALLPYPKSQSKLALLKRLKSEPSRQQRLRLKTWQLTAAWSAAAVLLFVLLYHLAQSPATGPRPVARAPHGEDRWLAGLLKKHQALAQASNAREQIETVTELADDVRDRTQVLVRFIDFKQLDKLAKLYGQAIEVGVARADDLPKADRRQVLEPIVKQLEKALALAEGQAREDRVGSADHPLITIASAARLGKDRLDGLLKDDAQMRGFSSGPCLAVLPTPWLTTFTAGRVAAARADNGTRTLATAEDLRQFERNRWLVERIVESSIRLAEKSDLITRAGHCNQVVERLADEIAKAAGDKEPGRVAELAQHLRTLLKEGVAFNLAKGGVDALPGSEREKQLLAVANQTIRLLNTLEKPLADPAYRAAFDGLRVGRKEVEIAIQGRGLGKK